MQHLFIYLKENRSKRESKASRKKKYSLRKQNIKSVEPEGTDHRKLQLDQINSFSNSNFNENHEIQRIMSSTKSKNSDQFTSSVERSGNVPSKSNDSKHQSLK